MTANNGDDSDLFPDDPDEEFVEEEPAPNSRDDSERVPEAPDEEFVEEEPEGGGAEAGKNTAAVFLLPLQLIAGFLKGFLFAVTRVLPYGRAFWGGVAKLGIKNMRKASGGDVVGIVGRGDGRLTLKPMKFKTFEDEPGSPQRWVSKDGEEWHPGAEGKGWKFIGSTPVGLFHETAVPRGSWFQSNYAEALQLGNKEQLLVNPNLTQEIVLRADADEAVSNEDKARQAVADGGVEFESQSFQVNRPGMLEDVLVDLDPGDGSQGMRVSTEKYQEVFQEKVGTEEMQMQEARGRAAEVDPEGQREMMFRFLKYFLGGVLLARSPELLALLMGESGAGVGSSIPPIMINAAGVLPL